MRFAPFLAVLCFAHPAFAFPWDINSEKSRIGFAATQSGEAFRGEFQAFSGVIDFDPAAPEGGKIEVTIPLARVTVEGKDRQEAITGKDWFDTAQFPEARFVSTSLAKDAEENWYLAKGDLTIKGVSQPVELRFNILINNNEATAHTSFPLERQRFSIGTGEFESDEWISYHVRVDAMIVATPAGGRTVSDSSPAPAISGQEETATPPAAAAPEVKEAPSIAAETPEVKKKWWKFW